MTTADTPDDTTPGALQPGIAGFRDATTLTKWLKAFLWIMIAVDVVAIISTFLEIGLLISFQQHLYPSVAMAQADAHANDVQQRAIGLLQIAVLVITGIVFLRWIFRANANARQLGAAGMRFTPGWSIGWYFIPFANLWKPYQAMKEIWLASAAPARWQDYPRGAILPWWWFCFLMSEVTGNISFRLAREAKGIPMLMTADGMIIVADAASIALSLVALVLVGQIYRMQMSHVRA
jgi:hypothetical protein